MEVCPKCGSQNIMKSEAHKEWQCNECGERGEL